MFLTGRGAGGGGGAGGTAVPAETLQMSNDGITMLMKGALKPLPPCAHRAGRTGHELGRGNPDRKPRGQKSEVPGQRESSNQAKFVCLLVGCLTSQQHASVSQGRICSDNFTCCHVLLRIFLNIICTLVHLLPSPTPPHLPAMLLAVQIQCQDWFSRY